MLLSPVRLSIQSSESLNMNTATLFFAGASNNIRSISNSDAMFAPSSSSSVAAPATVATTSRKQKLSRKKKEKLEALLEQASYIPMEIYGFDSDTYFKFPKIDFYLNINSVLSSLNSTSTVYDGNNIAVINRFKKITNSIISKKSNGVHIYLADRYSNESNWTYMVNRLRSFGNKQFDELSARIESFCQESFCGCDDTASTEAEGEFNSNYQQQSSSSSTTLIEEEQILREQNIIDDIFLQNKNKPMLMWKGANKQLHSIHLNESFLATVNFTPEEFQVEAALSGIPQFCTSFNYVSWMEEIMRGIKMLLCETSTKELVLSSKHSAHSIKKEIETSDGNRRDMDFIFYQMHIGMSNIIVEEGVHEFPISQRKKRTPIKQKEKCAVLKETIKNIPPYDENKRKLTSLEKTFINTHYFQIQDFEFNQEKLCKIKSLE